MNRSHNRPPKGIGSGRGARGERGSGKRTFLRDQANKRAVREEIPPIRTEEKTL
jgi:hypothetical protein